MGGAQSLVRSFKLTPTTKIIDIVKYITITKDYEKNLYKWDNVYNSIYGINRKYEIDFCKKEIDKCFNLLNYCRYTNQIKDSIDWSFYNSNKNYEHWD